MKKLKFKRFILKRFLPFFVIFTILLSCFIFSSSAAVVENGLSFKFSSITDVMNYNALLSGNSFFTSSYDGLGSVKMPLYSSSTNSKTVGVDFTCSAVLDAGLVFKNTVSNIQSDAYYDLVLPIAFLGYSNSSHSMNVMKFMRPDVYCGMSLRVTGEDSINFNYNLICSNDYVDVYRFYARIKGSSLKNASTFVIRCTSKPLFVNQEFAFSLYGGNISPFGVDTLGYVHLNYVTDSSGVLDPSNPNNPYSPNYNTEFGNDINEYFEFERNLLNSLDHNMLNSFFANLSIFDNFGNGIAAVRTIMNEFINYNGSQWTWLYNLLTISLFVGIVAFTLGFSVSIGGAIKRWSRPTEDRYKRNSIGFNSNLRR